ncbi:hypothetical protein LTS18_002552, partial [Coniosporium uncinatum]
MTKEWDKVWQDIRQLYVNEGLSLNEVRRVIRERHGFDASTRAYRMRIEEWGFKKRVATRSHTPSGQHVPMSPTLENAPNGVTPFGWGVFEADDVHKQLFDTVTTNRIAAVKSLLSMMPDRSILNVPIPQDWEPEYPTGTALIHMAVEIGLLEMTQTLLKFGADVNNRREG